MRILSHSILLFFFSFIITVVLQSDFFHPSHIFFAKIKFRDEFLERKIQLKLMNVNKRNNILRRVFQ